MRGSRAGRKWSLRLSPAIDDLVAEIEERLPPIEELNEGRKARIEI